MAPTTQCLASMARLNLSASTRPSAATIPKFLVPSVSTTRVRFASQGNKQEKKKRTYKEYRVYDRSQVTNYSLCDAIRYVRAFEVGRSPSSVKYDLAIKLKASKNGPVVRNRIRLPHPVSSDTRIAVICPEDSETAAEARALGAVAVGQESLFEQIRAGNMPFNKLICHVSSEDALKKANLGKMLGPKGLMPNLKTKTITRDVRNTMRDLAGAQDYREKAAVIRIPIAQLGFTPEMISENIKAFMSMLKDDLDNIDGQFSKSIDEVVLSATNSPGFGLNGTFASTDEKVQPAHLSEVM
ncbi:ribosomal protein L1 [Thozetella sp. PMI_491]|nr:ribosomal protein L1 [Thozetella sp. PMI_491]